MVSEIVPATEMNSKPLDEGNPCYLNFWFVSMMETLCEALLWRIAMLFSTTLHTANLPLAILATRFARVQCPEFRLIDSGGVLPIFASHCWFGAESSDFSQEGRFSDTRSRLHSDGPYICRSCL